MRLFTLLLFMFFTLSVNASEIISDPGKVNAIFSNKTTDAYHLKRDEAWTNYFAVDGSMRRVTENGDKHTGKWHINDDAEHCITWDYRGKEFCRAILAGNRDGIYFRAKIKGDRKIKKVRFKNFRDGNRLEK